MEHNTHEKETFEKKSWAGKTLRSVEFISCTFDKCDFTGASMGHCKFIDCLFESCNLSGLKISNATLLNARFIQCKILGVMFNECADMLFSVYFEACTLDYSSFMGKKMPGTVFARSIMREVNFIQANLSGAIFDQCDLSEAFFNETDLSGANFVTAYNYTVDPVRNKVRKASFSAQGLAGLLTAFDIHVV